MQWYILHLTPFIIIDSSRKERIGIERKGKREREEKNRKGEREKEKERERERKGKKERARERKRKNPAFFYWKLSWEAAR